MKTTRRGQGNVTVQDVARAAGVSAMTVSRVVNGGTNVREETRDAVNQAIERLRYRPNAAARTLAAGDATQIGLLYANPSAAYLSQFLVGALAGARRAGCHLVLEPCEGESAEAQAGAARQFVGAEVQGVILPPPLSESLAVREELARAGILWVAIALGDPPPNALNVRIDDFGAAVAMTRHLLDLGHTDIGFIRGNPNQIAAHDRYLGFVEAVEQAGLDPDAMRTEQGDFTFRSGTLAAERLLGMDRRPTAIFAGNDDMAAAAIGVAHRRGLTVPGDVSIVGFDDTAMATNVWPELTTISQPIARMAEAAVAMMLARLRADGLALAESGEEQVLPFELVMRASSGPPPGRPTRSGQTEFV